MALWNRWMEDRGFQFVGLTDRIRPEAASHIINKRFFDRTP